MRIGIRGHDLGKDTPANFAQSVVNAKLESLQLVLFKAIEFDGDGPPILNDDLTTAVQKELADRGVKVAMMGAYFNPVDNNAEYVAEAVENFKNHLKKAKFFGTDYVGTETGSCNDGAWIWHPDNSSEEAYQEVLAIFRDILPIAVEAGTYLTIEPAYGHIISTPTRLKRLVEDLDSPNVRIIFDLFNLLHKGNTHEQHQLIDEMVEFFNDKLVIVHAKDFKLIDGELVQVPPGKGDIDYPYLISKLKTLQTTPDIILEDVTGENIVFSREFIAKLL